MFDFHSHTYYSFDSLTSPKSIVKAAVRLGIKALGVTDHNSILGGLKTREACSGVPLVIVVGCEVNTDMGDVIGLFLNEEIRSRFFDDVVDQIKAQDGIVYLPHPYAHHTKLDRIPLERVEVIEVHNGRMSASANQRAAELARNLHKLSLGGSDCHILSELGSVVNQSDMPIQDEEDARRALLRGQSRIYTRPVARQLLPRARAVTYMSWIRSHERHKFLDRMQSRLRGLIRKRLSLDGS
jgi:predicted metal-dependent phosphoesterase TrpH